MLRNALLTLVLAGLATVAAAETVYKWIDAGGQVHYTDLPPDETGAKLLGVFERDLLLDGGQPDEDSGPATSDSADIPPSDEPGSDAATANTVQRDVQQAQSQQCKQAQERYQTYVNSRRLYRQLPDGKREYLSDAELTAARIEARKAVDDLCK